MKINVDKCKILSEDPPHLSVKTTALKKVDTFVFLGSLVTKTENMKRRMKKNIWSAKDRKKTEIRLFHAFTLAIAIYTAKMWLFTKENTSVRSL